MAHAPYPLFERLLEVLPRPYLNQIAHDFCDVRDPLPIIRSSLKTHILAADSEELRTTVMIWIVRQLLPDIETLNLR